MELTEKHREYWRKNLVITAILLAVWFIVQLSMGIYLIHWAAGWFVVGAGRNGMEFSALLILCLLVIAMAAPSPVSGVLTNQRRR